MRCPECDTMNRDDAAFCGMCKKLFRAAPRRSAPPPPPSESRSPSGVWRELLERLGASRDAAPAAGDRHMGELVDALKTACPPAWRIAELCVPLADPSRMTMRCPDDGTLLAVPVSLRVAIDGYVLAHAAKGRSLETHVIVVERQADGTWTLRWSIAPSD